MSDWRVRGNEAVPARPMGVDAVRQLSFLKDAHIHIGLVHTSQHGLQYSVQAVINIVGATMYQLPLPRRNPSTTAHPLPTYDFLSSSSATRPTRAGIYLPPFPVRFLPRRPEISIPVPVTVYVLPYPP